MKVSQRDLEPVPTIFTKIGDFLLKPFINKDLITHVLMGPFSFQVFRVSHELGLFDYLNKNPGTTLPHLSQQLNLEHYPLEILLSGLCSLKLVKKINHRYYNSAVTKIVTQDNSNKFTYFFPKYMEYAQHILLDGIRHLQESISENKPVGLQKIFGQNATDYYYELSKNTTANRFFAEHMSAFSQINATRLATLPLFNQIKSLLDVGGGVGSVALSIAEHHPELNITVFDHPSVAELANQKFRESEYSNRLNAIGGDVITNPFPEDFEGILFSHFIDIFSKEQNIDFFSRAFNALKRNGFIIVYTPVVNNEDTGPLVNSLLGIYFLALANGKGRFYSGLQISNWMKQTGFTQIKIHKLPSSEAIIIGMKP
jgi:ubiquinone/menaquinone biosynthesis C-methylase UbiE